ncbi:hypothetical protein [Okeania sp. KiyG1]|uniref:hypothetical protein n=1 Tax=Okeania sp. KiyG1 TaxID=2720165 RepID=UPI00192188B6|nr:hypothetical protein [Okeania sp. KiyG1]
MYRTHLVSIETLYATFLGRSGEELMNKSAIINSIFDDWRCLFIYFNLGRWGDGEYGGNFLSFSPILFLELLTPDFFAKNPYLYKDTIRVL